MNHVTLQRVRRVFSDGTIALDGIDLAIAEGSFVAIVGPSGCGKSTLLRLIAGLDAAQGGEVQVRPRSAPAERAASDVAFVFQDAHLLPWRTVLDNVALPLELSGVARSEARERARGPLLDVELSDAVLRYPGELSGGMRMRVSIARALVTEPRLLLLDEPFAALDEITRQRLDEKLRALWERRAMTVVFVTHSLSEAVFLAQRALVMSRRPGRFVLDRTVELPPGAAELAPDRCGLFARVGVSLRGAGERTGSVRGAPLRDVIVPPVITFALVVATWEGAVRVLEVPAFLVPPPSAVLGAAARESHALFASAVVTGEGALSGFLMSAVLGTLGGIVLSTSKVIERGLYPYALFLQTVPIVAVAPLLVLWFGAGLRAVAVSAFIVSVFPVVANTLAGLRSVDPRLYDLFRLYGGRPLATLCKLRSRGPRRAS